MKTIFKITGLILMIIICSTLSAQEKLILSIQKSVELGVENSNLLHMICKKIDQSNYKYKEANTAKLPVLSVSSSFAELSKEKAFEIMMPAGKQTISPSITENYSMQVTLKQPVFTGYKIESNIQISKNLKKALIQDYQKEKRELIYRIKEAYWNLYKTIEFKKVIDENIEVIKLHLKDINNFLSQGLVTRNDVLKVELQLSNVHLMQLDSQNAIKLGEVRLKNLIGIPLETAVLLTNNISPENNSYNDINEIIKHSFDNRDDIKALEYRIKSAHSKIKLAKSGFYPQISFACNYNYAQPNQRIQPLQDRFKDTWDAGLYFSYDIWDWHKNQYKTEQAKAEHEQTVDLLKQLQEAIVLEITNNYLNFLHSKEKINVAKKNVKLADETYRISKDKFQQGLELNSDLLEVEVSLLESKIKYTQALVDSEITGLKLDKSIGLSNY